MPTQDQIEQADDLRLEIAELTDERDGLAAEVRELTRTLRRLERAEEKARERLSAIRTACDAIHSALEDVEE